ncbi:MAG: family 78 glycoside hydrolase catalytic domain [Ignavibacteriaceae bacterium]
MGKNIYLFIIIMFTAALFVHCKNKNEGVIYPINLKCEYLTDPINIDLPYPNLSWQLKEKSPDLRNLSQSAYRVLVATCKELLQKNIGDLWDSGIIPSSNSTHVIYNGKILISRQTCYWKVQTFDQDKKVSNWSAISEWRMSLLSKNDWAGSQWIGIEKDEINSPLHSRSFQTSDMKEPVLKTPHVSPLLRTEFVMFKKIKNATVFIAGLGYAELYLNGKKIGDHMLDPGQTDYDVFSLYSTYDISKNLVSGKNAIGIMLGNGFYGQNIAFVDWLEYGKPRVRCKVLIKYEDGTEDSVVSNSSWKVSSGPIMYDNVYAGESYNAEKEQEGWCKTGFDDSFWQNAQIVDAPNDSLRSQLIPAIERIETIKPVKLFETEAGKWIVDLGQNIAGWVKIRVKEKPGRQITMRFAENLKSDGKELDFSSLGQFATGSIPTNIYICKSKNWEDWEPRFTFAGFRYIELSGVSHKPSEETIQGIVAHTNVNRIGHFSSSDSILNKIYNVSLWTIVDNLHSVSEDCPNREKCGWLGDAHTTAVTDLYNFDMYNFYFKYLQDIKSQLGKGGETYKNEPATPGIPGNIAPGKRICGEARVDWGAAVVLLPYYIYLYDGDIRPFQDMYSHMKDFIRYTAKYESEKGIIQNGYGDWCPPGGNEKMECPPELSSTALYYRMLDILSIMSEKLEDPSYSKWCTQKKDSVKYNFNKAYFHQILGTSHWSYGSQTADALAFSFGMVPNDRLDEFTKGLIYDINSLHDGHMSTGIHGSRYIYTILCKLGYEDMAYKLLTQPTYPSLAYLISCGLTTLPEEPREYNNNDVERGASFNHPMQSGFAAFYHEAIGGIIPDYDFAGFKHFNLHPYLINQLNWAKSDFNSYYGKIKSNWKNLGSDFIWDFEIPVNTLATIYVPGIDNKKIFEKGILLIKNPQVKYIKSEDGHSIFELGSGTYHIVSIDSKEKKKE